MLSLTPNTVQQAPTSNAPTFDTVLATIVQLGTQAGQGTDVQIKAFIAATEGAFHGALKQAHTDALKLASGYVQARGKHVVFNAKAPNQRKLISNFLKCIRLGSARQWGPREPMETVNKFLSDYMQLRKDPQRARKLDDPANAFLRFATAQLEAKVPLTGAQLQQYCFKSTPEDKTMVEVFEGVRKLMDKVTRQKVAHCADTYSGPEVDAIRQLCTKAITTIVTNNAKSKP